MEKWKNGEMEREKTRGRSEKGERGERAKKEENEREITVFFNFPTFQY